MTVTTPAASTTRRLWQDWLLQIAMPVLEPLAAGRLRATLPVEGKIPDRPDYTHLEAVARTLVGIAPWLETDPGPEAARARVLAVAGIAQAVDPDSPDCLNFRTGRQPVVDAAFLAQALLRAPTALIDTLSDPTRDRLIDSLRACRAMLPSFNNWLLFAALVEAGLHRLGADYDPMRVDYALRQHEQWYVGDGHYSDGPVFHWDYYNSLVIHPMMLDTVAYFAGRRTEADWIPVRAPIRERARRHAAILERLISPEGAIPPIGRSLAYRFGVLQLLGQAALQDFLPARVSPAQVRCAMTAAIRRMIEAPGTFDAQGYLTIGYCGHQPSIGEAYISTGSLYLCCAAFLPLGLPAEHPFWADPDAPWTQVIAYSGQDLPCDKAVP